MKKLYESILSSTNTGKAAINRKKIEDWLKENKLDNDYEIDDKNNISIFGDKFVRINGGYKIYTEIPKFIKIKFCSSLIVDREDMLNDRIIPQESTRLIFRDITIDDFSFLEYKECKFLSVHNCDIKSLNGLDKIKNLKYLVVSGNKKVYTKKELAKYSKLKINEIRNVGEYYYYFNSYVVSKTEVEQLTEKLEEIAAYVKKQVPSVKFHEISCGAKSGFIYLNFEFLNKEDISYGIRMNGIYLSFMYSVDDDKLVLHSNGHINITPEEKKSSKYKYFALKSLLDPYYDNGGKKFRKTLIKDFYSDEIAEKITPFIKDVIDEALFNQGGYFHK